MAATAKWQFAQGVAKMSITDCMMWQLARECAGAGEASTALRGARRRLETLLCSRLGFARDLALNEWAYDELGSSR